MKLTIEYTCHKCGLLTPGFCEVPDDYPPKRRVTINHTCHHCDEKMQATPTLGECYDSGGTLSVRSVKPEA